MPFLIFGGDAPELRHLELRNCLLLRQLPIRCLTIFKFIMHPAIEHRSFLPQGFCRMP